jgi:pyrroline-5-carboxylate reductase
VNLSENKIAFIGTGNMGQALIAGLKNINPKLQIIAADKNNEILAKIADKYKIVKSNSNVEAVEQSEIIIIAVKPQNIDQLMAEIANKVKGKLIISIVAGIKLEYLSSQLVGAMIIRAMPNNPALVKAGITALAANNKHMDEKLNMAKEIFSSVGEVVIVDEKLLDAITGLSGSGPAFVYVALQGLIEGGIKSGLPENLARDLALQTFIGAIKTAKDTGKRPEELIKMVASPGGTTEKGLEVLNKNKFKNILSEAVVAAKNKSIELSKKK